MPGPHPRANRVSLLILFGIGILNFLAQDNLHAGVWLSVAAGALATDLLDTRGFHPRVVSFLVAVETVAVGVACVFTAVLIVNGH